jgi:hypothetical protein
MRYLWSIYLPVLSTIHLLDSSNASFFQSCKQLLVWKNEPITHTSSVVVKHLQDSLADNDAVAGRVYCGYTEQAWPTVLEFIASTW